MRSIWVVVLAAMVLGTGAQHASAQGWGARPQPVWGQPQQPVYQQGYQPQPSYGGGGYAQPFRNFFVGAGLGFGVTFTAARAYFRVEENVGIHLLNVDEHPGLFLALHFSQGIASVVTTNFALRVGFDATAWQNSDVRVLVTPSVGVGVGLLIADLGAGQQVYPAVYIMPGLEVAVQVARGFMTVWYRPISFDILAADGGGAAYAMMAGANLNLP